MMNPFKPTPLQLKEAYGKAIPDIIDFNLKVLFCGINPGLYSGATGCHFARPGNRFWKVLFLAGFSEVQLSPFEGRELLKNGYGITNVVNKTTARADELNTEDFITGAKTLEKKVLEYKPKVLAILGVGAYRLGFQRPKAKMGLQDEVIGETRIWVLPNPSGLNASFNIEEISNNLKELKDFAENLKNG